MTVFLCGNSQLAALAEGVAEGRDPAAGPAGGAVVDGELTIFPLGNGKHEPTAFSRLTPAGVVFEPRQYAANLQRYAGRTAIAPGDTWGFLTINHNVRIYRDPMWKTYVPSALDLPGTPVTDDLLATIVARDHAGVRGLFAQLQEAGVDFFAVSAPHPRQDGTAVRNGVPRPVIAYLDALSRSLWRSWLGERGIGLVEPPPSTVTPDGFLDAAYGAGPDSDGRLDPHHANAAYGALMLARVREFLTTR
jgi:hypothetical protein